MWRMKHLYQTRGILGRNGRVGVASRGGWLERAADLGTSGAPISTREELYERRLNSRPDQVASMEQIL